jgi:Mg2+-importing ATPase
MNGAAAALASLWRRGFRGLPSLRHHDGTIAQRLIDAAGAEPEKLLKQLGTTSEGLTIEVAAQRLFEHGPNLIAHERQQSLVEELIGRAKNPLNFLLLSLAAVSYFLGDKRAAAVIAVMVLLSVSLAFVQEHRSNNAAATLRAMVLARTTDMRRREKSNGSSSIFSKRCSSRTCSFISTWSSTATSSRFFSQDW